MLKWVFFMLDAYIVTYVEPKEAALVIESLRFLFKSLLACSKESGMVNQRGMEETRGDFWTVSHVWLKL